mmetsp:Transcript_83/g.249  ORF Transcript_83/g.249 Transcript_83/m.249 type:complete len:258 (+) Transcript_83:2994-3767(+)
MLRSHTPNRGLWKQRQKKQREKEPQGRNQRLCPPLRWVLWKLPNRGLWKPHPNQRLCRQTTSEPQCGRLQRTCLQRRRLRCLSQSSVSASRQPWQRPLPLWRALLQRPWRCQGWLAPQRPTRHPPRPRRSSPQQLVTKTRLCRRPSHRSRPRTQQWQEKQRPVLCTATTRICRRPSHWLRPKTQQRREKQGPVLCAATKRLCGRPNRWPRTQQQREKQRPVLCAATTRRPLRWRRPRLRAQTPVPSQPLDQNHPRRA